MPVEGAFHRFTHADRAWQAAVQGWGPALGRNRSTTVEMHHLPGGMNTGIGATGGDSLHRTMWIERGDRLLQLTLNAGALALALPAAKRRTLILHADGNPSNADALSSRRGWRCSGLRGLQTNSMMAISALSPRRRTVRVMRV